MKTLNVISILCLLSSAVAFAQGGQEGHGGAVVTCFKDSGTMTGIQIADKVAAGLTANRDPNRKRRTDVLGPYINQISSAELYDLYLARHEQVSSPDEQLITPVERDYKKVLAERLDRIRATHYEFYKYILEAQKLLETTSWIESEDGVAELLDAVPGVTFPRNCLHLQLAAQYPVGDQTGDVYFDPRIFKRLKSVIDQAGIYLHEYVYKHFLTHTKVYNARSTQKIIRTVFKKNFGPERTEKFHALLLDLHGIAYSKLQNYQGYLYEQNYGADEALAIQDYERGFVQRTAGEQFPTRIKVEFLNRSQWTWGLDFYNYPARKEYAGLLWNALQFDSQDYQHPICGRIDDPSFPKSQPWTCNVELDENGNILSYSFRLAEPTNIEGYELQTDAWAFFDTQHRFVGFRSASNVGVQIPDGQRGLGCKSAVIRYEADGSRTIQMCEGGQNFGDTTFSGTFGFFPGN